MIKKQKLERKFTDEEVKRLAQFMEVLVQIDQQQKRLFARLNNEPKGFNLKGDGRNCSLCGNHVYVDGWFDKGGFKCLNCQDAVNKKKIPGSLCRDYNHNKSITDTQLAMKMGVTVHAIRKLIRDGKIIGRRIPNGPYMILRKDNPDLAKILKDFSKPHSTS